LHDRRAYSLRRNRAARASIHNNAFSVQYCRTERGRGSKRDRDNASLTGSTMLQSELRNEAKIKNAYVSIERASGPRFRAAAADASRRCISLYTARTPIGRIGYSSHTRSGTSPLIPTRVHVRRPRRRLINSDARVEALAVNKR